MQSIINTRNKKLLSAKKPDTNSRCNCQNKVTCPTPGECCHEKVVYKASVKHKNGSNAEYIGCTETSFKKQFANHKKSFHLEKYKKETTLSKYVWDQGLNPAPEVSWKFLKKCEVYEPGDKSCDLCLSEKHLIIKPLPKNNIINKRTDIGNKCGHKSKKTLQCLQPQNLETQHAVNGVHHSDGVSGGS